VTTAGIRPTLPYSCRGEKFFDPVQFVRSIRCDGSHKRGSDVEVRVGIINSPREIGFESSQEPGEMEAHIVSALESKSTFIKLADDNGKIYLVPLATLAYIEISSEEARRIGFVA
jgi:hypothetical protein